MKATFDRLVRDREELLRVQEYIRTNSSKARLRDSDFCLETRDDVVAV